LRQLQAPEHAAEIVRAVRERVGSEMVFGVKFAPDLEREELAEVVKSTSYAEVLEKMKRELA
jgi:dihydroorotate dehydrogenase